MRGHAQRTPGVGNVCGRMYVCYLDGRAKKQQEGATQSNGDPPRGTREIFGLLKEHHYNYNVCALFPVSA